MSHQQPHPGYPGRPPLQPGDNMLAGHSIWGAAYSAAHPPGSNSSSSSAAMIRPPGAAPAAGGSPTMSAAAGPGSSIGYGSTPPPPAVDPKQQQRDELRSSFQVCTKSILGHCQPQQQAQHLVT
jgi:hypothetical protein